MRGDELDAALGRAPKLLALTHASNVLGTLNPIAEIAERAHAAGALILVDGAQAAPKMAVDVAALDVDFYAFTGHKAYGPTGIGVLWSRLELLREMPPFLGGGSMIRKVTREGTTFADPPARFEAGTPAIAQAIGLAAALRWLDAVGMSSALAHEREMASYALERLADVPGLRVLGPPASPERIGPVSFEIEGLHPHDVAEILDRHGVAVRARPPLRAAADAAARHPGDRAGELRDLHRGRRDRSHGRGPARRAEGLRALRARARAPAPRDLASR